jgi:hypothetical protein
MDPGFHATLWISDFFLPTVGSRYLRRLDTGFLSEIFCLFHIFAMERGINISYIFLLACRIPVSVVFAIEYSTNKSFTGQKKSTSDIIQSISLGRVGILTYKDKAFTKIKIGQYEDNNKLISAVNDLKYENRTGQVNYSNVYSEALRAFRGEDSSIVTDQSINYTKTLVMFTHKWDTKETPKLTRLKKQLRSLGVKIVVLGLAEDIRKEQLMNIVNEEDHVYTVNGDDYQLVLAQKEPYILDTICRGKCMSRNERKTWSMGGVAVRALASHHCGPRSIPGYYM